MVEAEASSHGAFVLTQGGDPLEPPRGPGMVEAEASSRGAFVFTQGGDPLEPPEVQTANRGKDLSKIGGPVEAAASSGSALVFFSHSSPPSGRGAAQEAGPWNPEGDAASPRG
jgi:hypothetical protein